MAPSDWTARDKEIIESRYRIWKMTRKPYSRRGVVTSVAMKCGDMIGDPETWLASKWAQQIGRYYANREATDDGRPKAQTKTREQIALLQYAFSKTSGYPYTGEVLLLAFLTGLQVKQVKSWFENQRKTWTKDLDFLSLDQLDMLDMKGQDAKDAAAMVREYNQDPREYARALVMWERCVRTGCIGLPEFLQLPRPYLKKYWTRMFPEEGDERSLLEVTEELDGGSDDESIANLTKEEKDEVLTQSRIEHDQHIWNREDGDETFVTEEELSSAMIF